jgi:hypothetical protein
VLAWFSIAPDDGSGSYTEHVAAAVEVLEQSGLRYRLGAIGTEVEGPRDAVFAVLARCQFELTGQTTVEPGPPSAASLLTISFERRSSTSGCKTSSEESQRDVYELPDEFGPAIDDAGPYRPMPRP